MKDDFAKAKRTFRSSGNRGPIEFVNGCCYGRANNPDKGTYHKFCGQEFWEFISGSPTLYKDLTDALAHKSLEANAKFKIAYEKVRARLIKELEAVNLADEDGTINWHQFAEITSKEMAKARKLKKGKKR